MIALLQIINFILNGFNHLGAHHARMLVVSPHMGWVETHHWLVNICYRGSSGCHF